MRNIIFVMLMMAGLHGCVSVPGESDSVQGRIIGIGADLQPWRTLNGGEDPNDSGSQALWETFVLPGMAYLGGVGEGSQRGKAEFIMINGDMTDYGWSDQRGATDGLLYWAGNPWGNIPIFFGLGNHDISNNVGDCWDGGWMSSDACAYNTSNWFRDYVWRSFNPNEAAGINQVALAEVGSAHGWSSSNAYSLDWRKTFRFIQLNYYPEYTVHLGHAGGTNNVAWSSALGFLRSQLEDAESKGLRVILNWHAAVDASVELESLMSGFRGTIAALFTGHTHQEMFEPDFQGTTIPHYTSGALMNKESHYLIVYAKSDIGDAMEVDIRMDVSAITADLSNKYINSIVFKENARYLCTNGSSGMMTLAQVNDISGCQELPPPEDVNFGCPGPLCPCVMGVTCVSEPPCIGPVCGIPAPRSRDTDTSRRAYPGPLAH